MLKRTKIRLSVASVAAAALAVGVLTTANAAPWSHSTSTSSWLSPNVVTASTSIKQVSSTVASNGDTMPRGVALVPRSVGNLVAGDLLVSNTANKSRASGLGSSIVEINPVTGRSTLFSWLTSRSLPSTCSGGVGLTMAITVLKDGWVIVGSTPTTNGNWSTMHGGCLIVLNSHGQAKAVISGHGIDGPNAITTQDFGNQVEVFVSNIGNGLSGTKGVQVNKGTVVRLKLTVSAFSFQIDTAVIVASGFPEMISKSNMPLGPTGLALIGNTLFIADTLGNRIASIPAATTRHTSDGLGGTIAEGGLIQWPTGLIALPSGVLLTTNGFNGNLVAITTRGKVALVRALDTTTMSGWQPGATALSGMVSSSDGHWVYYADNVSNWVLVVGPLGTGWTTSSTNMWSNTNNNSSTTLPAPVPTSTPVKF